MQLAISTSKLHETIYDKMAWALWCCCRQERWETPNRLPWLKPMEANILRMICLAPNARSCVAPLERRESRASFRICTVRKQWMRSSGSQEPWIVLAQESKNSCWSRTCQTGVRNGYQGPDQESPVNTRFEFSTWSGTSSKTHPSGNEVVRPPEQRVEFLTQFRPGQDTYTSITLQ